MNILIFDTATSLEFIIVGSGPRVLTYHENVDRTHSAAIFQNMEALLRQAGLGLDDIDLMAVGIGPGSFTGIRIAVTTARMLAQIMEIPLMGIKTHELYAVSVPAAKGEQILVTFDAKKKRVFGALYLRNEDRDPLIEIVPPGDYEIELLLQKTDPRIPTWCAGDGIIPFREQIERFPGEKHFLENFTPSGERIAELVMNKLESGDGADHYSALHPFYARKSDAETARGR